MLERKKLFRQIPSKTWVEIDKGAVRNNIKTFRRIIGNRVKLLAVVKSNAYGHGLLLFSRLADAYGVDGFCVDSLEEGIILREAGIKKCILVLGFIHPAAFSFAAGYDITVTISSVASLQVYCALSSPRPKFHMKVDTGMHRQGFSEKEAFEVVDIYHKKSTFRQGLNGIYTHFAAATDMTDQAYTEMQFFSLQRVIEKAKTVGLNNLTNHCAATGGVLLDKKYHLDAVRIGIGIYGLWPSKKLRMQRGVDIPLHPVMAWYSIVSEVKELQKGEYIGYDLTERAVKRTQIVIIPIGYWHGYPRTLSSVGTVIIGGKKARIIGRVTMDIITVDSKNNSVEVGDVVKLFPCADDVARTAGTINYEFVTRINPEIERRIR
ncbi:MAG: alanine racemase [bacterium]